MLSQCLPPILGLCRDFPSTQVRALGLSRLGVTLLFDELRDLLDLQESLPVLRISSKVLEKGQKGSSPTWLGRSTPCCQAFVTSGLRPSLLDKAPYLTATTFHQKTDNDSSTSPFLSIHNGTGTQPGLFVRLMIQPHPFAKTQSLQHGLGATGKEILAVSKEQNLPHSLP